MHDVAVQSGIQSPQSLSTSAADVATCTAILREGSKSFALAGRVLPQRLRGPVNAVYAFCRQADDAIDTADAPAKAVQQLRLRLDHLYDGAVWTDPVDRALAPVLRQFELPRALFEALLEGFVWDATGRTYATLADLHAYNARVASSVGVIMTRLMGVRDPQVLARACDLGAAMQLTNIARDVGEDARLGRLYLPTTWLQADLPNWHAWLAQPKFHPAIAHATQKLLDEAAWLYERAEEGVAHLPADCRMAIQAARLIYADIGRGVRQRGYNNVDMRAVVPWSRKIWLLCRASTARWQRPKVLDNACLPQMAFLVANACDAGEALAC